MILFVNLNNRAPAPLTLAVCAQARAVFFYWFRADVWPTRQAGMQTWKGWRPFMNLMKNFALVVWTMAWLLAQAAKDVTVSFVKMMRVALGEDGEPVSIITFLVCMAASVVMISFTGMLIAAFRIS